MTIGRALAAHIETLGYGTFGTSIFLGAIPKENAPSAGMWIIGGGGSSTIKNQTGERVKIYIFSVFFRSSDSEEVDTILQQLEEELNSSNCTQLEGYDTIELEASGFQSDQDLDLEDRTVGVIEVSIRVYQSN